LKALDKAIEAGGDNLTATAVASGKAGAATIAELCQLDYLAKSGGSKPKYTVTAKGRAAWENEVSEDRKREVRLRDEVQQKQALLTFLTAVEKKKGKAFTANEVKKLSEELINKARDEQLVERTEKANAYRLLENGEYLVLATKPLDEQLQFLATKPVSQQIRWLRELQVKTVAQWRTAHQQLAQQISEIANQDSAADISEIGRRGEEACKTFDDVLAEQNGLARVTALAREFRASVANTVAQATKKSESNMELLTQALETAGELKEEMKAVEQRMTDRLTAIEQQVTSGQPKVPLSQAVPKRPESAEAEVWAATREGYHRLKRETASTGGIVTIPELSDSVRATFADLSVAAYHRMLLDWEDNGWLVLKLCNDRANEKRANEGIESPRGLLFYVVLVA
jgi:hypothetical protein